MDADDEEIIPTDLIYLGFRDDGEQLPCHVFWSPSEQKEFYSYDG
jgi:hypothetical protein